MSTNSPHVTYIKARASSKQLDTYHVILVHSQLFLCLLFHPHRGLGVRLGARSLLERKLQGNDGVGLDIGQVPFPTLKYAINIVKAPMAFKSVDITSQNVQT